jgi:hypothetical protein
LRGDEDELQASLAKMLFLLSCVIEGDPSVNPPVCGEHNRRTELLRGVLRQTLSAVEVTRKDLAQLLRQSFPQNHVITAHSDRIAIDDVIFIVQGERITDVIFGANRIGSNAELALNLAIS